LNRTQICYAKKMLRSMHPLYELEIETCMPFLDPCIGIARRNCCKQSEQVNEEEMKGLAGADALKEGEVELDLSGERGKNEPKFDFFLEEGEDAMTRFGYGIVSYFSLIYTFMIVFGLITCLNIPVMYNFSTWSAFDQYAQISWTTGYTVGNMGAS